MSVVGHKSWWGPRIWRILHCLAEISDRRDCGPGWRVVLLLTAQMLPCDVCRGHFTVAGRGVRIVTGVAPRAVLRHMLWATHASSREGGSLDFPESELSAVYSYGGDRAAVIAEVRRLVTEVCSTFRSANVLDRFRVGHLADWERAVERLVGLLAVPEMTVSGRRGRR